MPLYRGGNRVNLYQYAGLLVAFAAVSVPARANLITLTLENANQSVAQGASVTFTGDFSISGTDTPDTFVNGDDFPDLTGLVYVLSADPSDTTQVVADDTDFVLSVPFCMNPTGTPTDSGDCSGSAPASIPGMDLFTVTAGANAAPGTYTGTFEILGGGISDSGPLASQDFTVVVTAQESGSAAPEPGTFWLLAPAAILPVWRRARK